MTDVPNHVGSNPACMLWHTSVTANVPTLLRVRAHACILQYGNACTYARDNTDGSTFEVSSLNGWNGRRGPYDDIRESRVIFREIAIIGY